MRIRGMIARCLVVGSVAAALSAAGTGLASAGTCWGSSLSQGSSGACVQYLQQMLNAFYAEDKTVNNGGRPYPGGGLLTVDAAYGTQTTAQVKAFEAYAAVPATGNVVAGSGIWKKLCGYAENGETAAQRSGSAALDSDMRTGVTAGIKAGCAGSGQGVSKLVSLGGSIAAGLGLATPLTIRQNGSTVSGTCGRTEQSFDYILAKEEGLQLVQIACSGAKTTNVKGAELSQAAPDIKGNVVSVAFTGANDIGFIGAETDCLKGGCTTVPGYPTIPQGTLDNQVTPNIKAILTTLHSEGAKAIIVDDYYMVTQGDPGCINPNFTAADYTWLKKERDALNAAIANGVTQANVQANVGAKLVTPHFSGHGVCDSDPYVAFPGHGKGAAEHPTKDGQVYLAKINKAALDSLL